jgi:hypothetical protein
MLVAFPGLANADDRVKQASDLILQLCIAGGVQNIEITKKDNSIEVAGKSNSLQLDRREFSGLVGGISKEITVLSAQQASEARSCTQKYLKDLLELILRDDPSKGIQGTARVTARSTGSISSDPEAFWGGRGIWQDNQNYCQNLLDFLSATYEPGNFRYKDSGTKVSARNISGVRTIEGNFFMRTEPGSTAGFCVVDAKGLGWYIPLECSREVSVGKPDVFASVYNQTLKDIRDCLVPAGWKQTTVDQGACVPGGSSGSECMRRFSKGPRNVWLYSNLKGSSYRVGIQTELGP